MKLIFATGNLNKLAEVQNITPKNIELIGLDAVGITEDIPETGNTLETNALQKARYVYEKTQLNCFADDTGLQVFALNNEPGVYSARYAGPQKNANDNMDLVLKNLADKESRLAEFATVIALIYNGKEYLFEGKVIGKITKTNNGVNGFGYDPIFQPKGYEQTFAEMTINQKNEISHRAKAFQKLKDFLSSIPY